MNARLLKILALIVVGLFAFAGCADSFTAYEGPEIAPTAYDGPKLRHAHLLDRAVRITTVGKGASSSSVGLIIKATGLASRFGLATRYGLTTRYEYNEVFYGLAAEVDGNQLDSVLAEMENDPDIIWVEPDFSVTMPPSNATDGDSGQQIPWSVAAVGGQTSWAVSGDGTGTVNVDVYILDTGMANADNGDPDDDLALVESIDFRDGFDDAKDYYGHGTHLAGIIGAIDDSDGLVGLAPGAKIHNLKVLGDDGTSDVSVVIAAVEYITALRLANPSTPMVVNLSLGEDIDTPSYSALDEAVDASTAAGVVYVIAAGNESRNVSNVTPAKVEGAITVGSYDINGGFSSFSNWGPKVDILAPGEGIISLGSAASGASGPVVMTGTSMSASHVTGAAALYLAQNPSATPAQVEQALVDAAQSFVTGTNGSTTNKSVWVGVAPPAAPGGSETVRDEFLTISYSGNDGSTDWGGDWQEIGDDGNPIGNEIRVVSENKCPDATCLRIKTKKKSRGILRAVDLSGAGTATLSFDYRRDNTKKANLALEISSDGGSTWTTLKTYAKGQDSSPQHDSFDITPYVSANTQIRFYVTFKGDRYFYVDNVEVEIDGGGGQNPPPPPPPTGQTLEVRIASSYDDAEESLNGGGDDDDDDGGSGGMDRTSSDLELVDEGSTPQLVGMRFTGITIPQGATITNAYIQFTVDETDSEATSLTIHGQDADDAASFSSSDYNISSRATTSASAAWSPTPWNSVGQAGPNQRTPDLSSILQEIVDRGGWSSGNALVILVTGTGERTAESYDGSSSKAPLLHVEWQNGASKMRTKY